MKKLFLLFAGITAMFGSNQAQTITDYDGNVYNTVTIGRQVWTRENLKTTHFNNGIEIPEATSAWGSLTTSAYCNYDNDDSNVGTYGRLYNWFAAADSNRICPSGWHVPTDADWIVLSNHLGNDSTAGGKLKEAGTTHWAGPNTGASNSSGFTALPGGNRSYDFDGVFGGIRNRGHWWSSSELNASYAWHRSLYYDSEGFFILLNGYVKQSGFSVRCLRDSLASATNEKNPGESIRIYPNPATDMFVIDCLAAQNLKLYIYNLAGEKVMQKDLIQGPNNIDIRGFKKGFFAVEVRGNGPAFYSKLIKE